MQRNGSTAVKEDRPKFIKRLESHIQSKTLAGLFDLVPTLVTIIVVLFLVEKADALIRPLPFIAGQPWDFPGIGLIAGIILFYLFGVMISTSIGRQVSALINTIIGHIPVIKAIFGITQQITASVASQYSFSRVVFLEWPKDGMIAMGFVTGRAYSTRNMDSMALVYIPTIPNPTSGNMALVIEDDLIETDLTVDAAMKLVFSGGIVLPDSLVLARLAREKPEEFELIGKFEIDPNKVKVPTQPSNPGN